MNFTNIYNENYKWVLNLINSRIHDKSEAEELTNDVFLKIHQHLSEFDEDKCSTGMVGWIRSMVFNKIVDHYRKRKLDLTSIDAYVDDEGKDLFQVKDSTDIEDEYCTNELIDNAKHVINTLPNPYRKVATMFYLKDLSYDEIVQATGTAIGTIKGQLSRARKLMQTEFGVA